MANSRPINTNEKAKLYSTEIAYRQMIAGTFFSNFMGFYNPTLVRESNKADSNFVKVETRLEKNRGDTVYFYMAFALEGAGVSGSQRMKGNEEALNTQVSSVTLDLYRNAVMDDGTLQNKFTAYDLQDEMNKRLKVWGTDKIDTLCATAIQTDPTKVFYLNSSSVITSASGTSAWSTAKGAITAANSKLSVGLIRALRTYAYGADGSATAKLGVIPAVKIAGKDTYGLIVHPNASYDLRADTLYEGAVKEAERRGADNPFFSGALCMVDGVAIFEYSKMNTFTDGGSGGNVTGSQAVLLGADALMFAWGKRPYVTEEEEDYGLYKGICWNIICSANKTAFKHYTTDTYATDYSAISVALANTGITSL